MKAFIASLASFCPPFSHACLTSSVLNSVCRQAEAAGSAEAENVASTSAETMEVRVANNPSFDILLKILGLRAWLRRAGAFDIQPPRAAGILASPESLAILRGRVRRPRHAWRFAPCVYRLTDGTAARRHADHALRSPR